ncbi:MAG TPA: universal stress protein [Dehalococcoidia bacterium]|jgi:nucleotide-binding universal stress UspA family protein
MFETIVLPLDGSDVAEQAFVHARGLAKELGATLVMVQAIDSLAQRMSQPPALIDAPAASAMTVEIMQEAQDAEKESAEKYLAAHRDALIADGIKAEAYVGEGPPVEVIMKLAQDKRAGMIVMCTHGRGGLGRLVFGSVADAVLKSSTIPILLIRAARTDKD